jgi:hypothetical protein
MEVIKKLDNGVSSILSTLIKEPTLIRGSIHLLLMLYAARIAPKLPDAVLGLFENQYFKLFVFALILWTAQFSPSTSILISIAFMVSVNYANQKPLWEFMDGGIQLLEEDTAAPETMAPETTTAAPETTTMAPETMAPTTTAAPETTAAIEAVVVLANAAASTTAVPAEQVIPVAQVAAAAVTTPAGLQAVQALAEQAVVPTPAPTPEVQRAVDQAVESIVTPAPVAAPEPSPEPTPAPVVPKVAIAEPAPTTTASPQVPEQGCYPIRRYDMAKVSPQFDLQYGFEKYQEFKA